MAYRKVPAPRRLLVDITPCARVEDDLRLGLDLPLANIAHRLLSQPDLAALPVVVRDGRLLAIDPDDARASLLAAGPTEGETVLHWRPQAIALPAAARQRPAGWRLRVTGGFRWAARKSVAALPSSIREDVRAVLIHARGIARTLTYGSGAPSEPSPAPATLQAPSPPTRRRPPSPPPLGTGPRLVVHPRPGDVLWTGGTASPWTAMRAISGMRSDLGLRVVALTHDLPPLRENTLAPVTATLHAELLQGADLLLASSAATADALRETAARLGWPAPPIRMLPSAMGPEAPPPCWPDALPRARFALATGGITRDNGIARLVALWEEWVAGPEFTPNLIILGAPGEDADGAVRAIESSALFGTRIFWLREAAGPLLRHLHTTCDLLLCPGPGEAWPAAVIEALWLGRPVIAARRGTIPPESLGLATLVDPDAPEAWRAAILAALAENRPEHPLPPMPDPIAVEAALRNLFVPVAAA